MGQYLWKWNILESDGVLTACLEYRRKSRFVMEGGNRQVYLLKLCNCRASGWTCLRSDGIVDYRIKFYYSVHFLLQMT